MFFEELLSLFPMDEASERLSVSYSVMRDNGEQKHISLEAHIYETMLSEADINTINRLVYGAKRRGSEDQTERSRCMELTAVIDEHRHELEEIYDVQYRIGRARRLAERSRVVRTSRIAPFDHCAPMKLTSVLGNMNAYEALVGMLRTYDDAIQDIRIVPSEFERMAPDYRVFVYGQSEGMPLSAYGDGMKKALMLFERLYNARNGILLIDEFETAIHTSAMSETFDLILRQAMELNVQVFMTSHSKEAIERVLHLAPEIQEQINVYTLYRHEGASLARRMSCAEALRATEYLGMDLR
jgi:hypothetical protein